VRLPARSQVQFLNLVADALPDDLLGFHLALGSDLREIGLLYYVLASSDTVVEALRRAVRYSVLVNEGLYQQCVVGRHLTVVFEYIGVGRHLDRHQAECWMLLIVRMLRELTGTRLSARRVSFVHARTKTPTEFIPYFGRDIKFGARADEISFAASVGKAPVVSADPYLNKLLVRHYEEALSRRPPGRGSIRASVESAIVPLLPHGEATIGEIARQVGLGPRTLARRLSAEGLSFSAVLGQLRLDLAKRHLADGDMSISEIAWLLGYQEVSAFSKAFKRWTGNAPRLLRGGTRHGRRRAEGEDRRR